MAGTRELLRSGQASRAAAHHRHLLAGLGLGRLGLHPTLGPGAVDDGVLDGLDTHGIVIHVQRAGGLARGGADAAGELREVVGGVQHLDGALPVATEHQVVEVRDDVVDRAAAVAEGRAAVHAARPLHLGLLLGQADDELFPVLQALGHGLVALFQALKLEEAGDFSHDVGSLSVLTVRMVRIKQPRPPGRPWPPAPWRRSGSGRACIHAGRP